MDLKPIADARVLNLLPDDFPEDLEALSEGMNCGDMSFGGPGYFVGFEDDHQVRVDCSWRDECVVNM